MKVSVVISAYNEENKIEECLNSVKDIASEIIFIDNSSTDKTLSIAKRFTDSVYHKTNNLMLNVNKNFGFEKATGPWVLSLDADERISEDLAKEIEHLDENANENGYFVPRKNLIFGKWMEHTGWYPDYQLRLFRKNLGRFEEKHVHEMLHIEGSTGHLKSPIKHINYETVSQFLEKMIRVYTVSEAENLLMKGYQFSPADAFKMPISEFVSRFFLQKGYRDGLHGLSLSLLMGFYHFVVFLRLWEKNSFKEYDDSLKLFGEGSKFTKKQIGFWMANEKLSEETNLIKKQLYRIRRKTNAT